MASNLNKIKNLPFYQQIIIAVFPSVLLTALFVYFLYIPKQDELRALTDKLARLDSEIAVSEAKIRKLDQLIAENKVLKARLAVLKEQLPEEKEVSVLLKQISELGLRSGLEILLWKPEARKTDPESLYVEIPVKVEVMAEYHKFGDFLSHISRLPRLVNISDISMQTKTGGKRAEIGLINTTFIARTFASADPQDQINSAASQGTGK